MIIMYAISISFAIMAMITNNLGQLLAAVLIAGIATFSERIGK